MTVTVLLKDVVWEFTTKAQSSHPFGFTEMELSLAALRVGPLLTSPAPVPAQLRSVFYPMEEEGWGKGLGSRVAEGLNILIWSTKYM